jgi:hypothetical protein
MEQKLDLKNQNTCEKFFKNIAHKGTYKKKIVLVDNLCLVDFF